MNAPTTSNMVMPNNSTGIISKLKTAGGSLNTTTIFLIAAIILFGVLGFLYYYYYISPKLKSSYRPNSERVPEGTVQSSSAELLFFFADWCPHCKAAKPIWNDLKSEYENKTINGYKVVFTEIDCSTETAETEEMMNKYKIEGFPTIKLLKDGQVVEYDAKPSKETLTQFLNTVL